MEAVCSSETLIDFHRATLHFISEDNILHDRYENMRSCRMYFHVTRETHFKQLKQFAVELIMVVLKA
jgi:hypothetical protein